MPKRSPPPFPRGGLCRPFDDRWSSWFSPGEDRRKRAHEFGSADHRNRAAQADRDDGRCGDGPGSVEREEMRRLRREPCRRCEERAIVATAAVWFAREVGSVRSPGSSKRIRPVSGLPRGPECAASTRAFGMRALQGEWLDHMSSPRPSSSAQSNPRWPSRGTTRKLHGTPNP